MSTEAKPTVSIKGIRDGLMVTLGDGDWSSIQEALLQQIDERENFFTGARLAIDVGNRIIHAAELGTLRDRLSDKGVSLWAVISNAQDTEQTAQSLGLATRIAVPRPDRSIRSLETTLEGEDAIFVQRTLRSGYKIATRGHVVVVGDVNPGAEIIAGGSVVVWGRLRGTVHAGAEGNIEAVVCALELSPIQLRIADKVAVSPQRKGIPEPEIVRIRDGQVVAESWNY